ncbi:MAG: SpoIIIAH-like family protein [Lachnospiraceae bacterium]|nr:SpoIIIAH-like family protein [Lachnospiraceae bacterium]MEE1015803.1 SpoIIIAH-like family protein [Lachnospiraceae bacterium]
MKTSFKKNQLIITALAVMIAIAGYLKYSDSMIDSEQLAATSTSAEDVVTSEELEMDISAEDIYASTGITEEATELETVADEQPGEAVLTSADTASYSFASEAKLSRDQTRAKNTESLLEIINSEVVSEEQKQAAIDQMLEITDISERETGAETLLAAKGFEDVVVSISDSKVDVVINQSEISDVQRAQIEDVITRKTGMAPENIVITPMVTAE